MNATMKIMKYELNDVLRGKWIIVYSLLFLIITDSLFRFGGDTSRVMLSLMNLILMVIPMVSIIFGSLYLYNSREFIELLLSQPINRKHLYFGMYMGIAVPLTLGFVLGTLIPFLYSGMNSLEEIQAIFILLSTGLGLTLIFLALSFLISVIHEDRVKGLGTSVLLWLFFTVIYDGLILFIVYIFDDYPLERTMLLLSLFNPVDLGRILLMLEFDISAMMGYTGAVFQQFFSSSTGLMISASTLVVWIIIPLYLGLKRFVRKDF